MAATNTLEAKARELLGHLQGSQLAAVVQLLEAMVRDEDDELTDEDRRAIARSREYFQQGKEGVSFEQFAADCGFTMDQIRETPPPPADSPKTK